MENPLLQVVKDICSRLGLECHLYKDSPGIVFFTPLISTEDVGKTINILFECEQLGFAMYLGDMQLEYDGGESNIEVQIRLMKETYIDAYLEVE